jgi:hypothetical protein
LLVAVGVFGADAAHDRLERGTDPGDLHGIVDDVPRLRMMEVDAIEAGHGDGSSARSGVGHLS